MRITAREEILPIGKVTVYRLENSKGHSVEVSTLGAGVLSVNVPDRMGNIENIALSYANLADYDHDGPCLGKVPGRYANRIAAGRFTLCGKEHQLRINNGPNHLHGGPDGFQNRIWDAQLLPNGVRMKYVSRDWEEQYPGRLSAEVDYLWDDTDTLRILMRATTDAHTIVNLTSHIYWNLDGADAGSILDHEMRLKADRWLPTDDTLVPTGALDPVADTPMDFRKWKRLGQDINADFPALKYGKGYDNCWVLNHDTERDTILDAVELRSEKSGRTLRMHTDQPGVQVYTGNWLEGSAPSRSGRPYHDYEGVAIEAQDLPDAPNKPHFPSTELRPGELYERHITFKFN